MPHRGLLALLMLVTACVSHAADGPVIPPATHGEACVADTDIMRKEHMSLLNHQRDETVIEGIRGEPFSLVGCVNCHAQNDDKGQPIRIDAKGQFCESCHTFAAVKIDCFTCHAALPEENAIIGALPHNAPAAAMSEQQLLVMQSRKVAQNASHD
jgi:hypothetical protein